MTVEAIVDVLGPVMMLLAVVYRRHSNFAKWAWGVTGLWVIWQIYRLWFRPY